LKYFKILFLFAITTTVLFLYGCQQGSVNEPCNERITLENAIPATTVAVGDTLFIDLTNPPMFVSSEGNVTYTSSIKQGSNLVNINILENTDDNQRLSILSIIGKSVGESVLELQADSGCIEDQTTIDITITGQ
jgi:hypothetical protein